jgi:hypothetical protein
MQKEKQAETIQPVNFITVCIDYFGCFFCQRGLARRLARHFPSH